ncbi:hypothetical protein L596_002276 [Steinernema carpocapsae]|uniref:Uncharacterized protein n=1 Tax=Steinernema carpocapsae TaxID=34508 RepID=A0A4U8UP44_STECR|nr:hypothetical protein L596_002276 [Steinernema carpocapsae]
MEYSERRGVKNKSKAKGSVQYNLFNISGTENLDNMSPLLGDHIRAELTDHSKEPLETSIFQFPDYIFSLAS